MSSTKSGYEVWFQNEVEGGSKIPFAFGRSKPDGNGYGFKNERSERGFEVSPVELSKFGLIEWALRLLASPLVPSRFIELKQATALFERMKSARGGRSEHTGAIVEAKAQLISLRDRLKFSEREEVQEDLFRLRQAQIGGVVLAPTSVVSGVWTFSSNEFPLETACKFAAVILRDRLTLANDSRFHVSWLSWPEEREGKEEVVFTPLLSPAKAVASKPTTPATPSGAASEAREISAVPVVVPPVPVVVTAPEATKPTDLARQQLLLTQYLHVASLLGKRGLGTFDPAIIELLRLQISEFQAAGVLPLQHPNIEELLALKKEVDGRYSALADSQKQARAELEALTAKRLSDLTEAEQRIAAEQAKIKEDRAVVEQQFKDVEELNASVNAEIAEKRQKLAEDEAAFHRKVSEAFMAQLKNGNGSVGETNGHAPIARSPQPTTPVRTWGSKGRQ